MAVVAVVAGVAGEGCAGWGCHHDSFGMLLVLIFLGGVADTAELVAGDLLYLRDLVESEGATPAAAGGASLADVGGGDGASVKAAMAEAVAAGEAAAASSASAPGRRRLELQVKRRVAP